MRHPAEYWLKYMLMFSDLSNAQISETAVMYGMQPPSIEYLSGLREGLMGTRPSPFRMDFAPSRNWVRRQRFLSMARGDEHASNARELLGNTKCRKVVETLLLANMEVGPVSEFVLEITGVSVPKKTVDLYRHYFWNRDLLSTREWLDYLDEYENGKMLSSCYSQGGEYALWKLGHRVDLPKEEVLSSVFHESAMRFFETSQFDNTRDTAMTAKLWAESLFKANEELEKSGDAVKQVLDNLKDIAIKLGKRDITSIDDLGEA
tara:strand:- start:11184 stop:11969 length:786 start_codon:yes stop_codon:yes gene_type:complete